jgi:hypothetical protein
MYYHLFAVSSALLLGLAQPIAAQSTSTSLGGVVNASTAPMPRYAIGILAGIERSAGSWAAFRMEAGALAPIRSAEHLVCPATTTSCDSRTTSWTATALGTIIVGSTGAAGPFVSAGAGGYRLGWNEGGSGGGPTGLVTTGGLGWRWMSGDRLEMRFSEYRAVTSDPGRVLSLQFARRF